MFTFEWRFCTLIRFSVADGFDVNLASLFVVSNSMKVGFSVQSFEEGIPLLRRQLSYHWQHLFRQGKLHLELGDQLVFGLVLGLDLVWPTAERHVWHHVRGVVWLR
jgi:hypothetical protein